MADANVITETDPDDDGPRRTTTVDLPANLSARGNTDQGGYEIVDAYSDDDFKPLTGPAAQRGDDIRGEDDVDETPRERRERETNAERRARRQRGKQQANQTIAEQNTEIERLRAESEENRRFRASVETRFSQFDQGRHGQQVEAVQREIQATAEQVQASIDKAADAMSVGDAEAYRTAMREQTRLTARGYELQTQKAELDRTARQSTETDTRRDDRQQDRQQDRQPQRQRMNPEVQERANEFKRQHAWINFDQPDLDTRIAFAIDAEVAKRGFNPLEDDYWDEVEDELRLRLPHRFAGTRQRQQTEARQEPARERQTQPERRGPRAAQSGNGGGNGSGGRQRVALTPERKDALIAAGVLEQDGRTIRDQKRFDGIAKKYLAHDREQAASRS